MEIELPSNLPVGYRFHPSDVELVTSYLKPKIAGRPFDSHAIAEVDLCKSEPWELPLKSKIKSEDQVWWFLCPRDPNSKRTVRTTELGFWKITGKERLIKDDRTKVCVGRKKTLVFYSHPQPGKRTNWLMHEIYLDPDTFTIPPQMTSYVICKLKKKMDVNVDTPPAEITFDLLSAPTGVRITQEDIFRSLDEESPEEFADGLIVGDQEEADLVQTPTHKRYFSEAPDGSDTDAEGANGRLYFQSGSSSGSFDSSGGSKKVRQMRMSNMPSQTLKGSVMTRDFVQELTVVPDSAHWSPEKPKEPPPVLSKYALTTPESPDHDAVAGGKREMFTLQGDCSAIKAEEGAKHVPRKSMEESRDEDKVAEKGGVERRLKSSGGESGGHGSKWRGVITVADTSTGLRLSPSEYWFNLVSGTVLFAVFVRELVVFGDW